MKQTIITVKQKKQLFKLMALDENIITSGEYTEYDRGCRDELKDVMKYCLGLYEEYEEWKGEKE